MSRLTLVYGLDEYNLPVTVLYLDDENIAQLWHKPWHKMEPKSTGYRELFYCWLREADERGENIQHSDELCEKLGQALTRQEWRYFKQAYYLAFQHVRQEQKRWGLIVNHSVVANFSRVRGAYESKAC